MKKILSVVLLACCALASQFALAEEQTVTMSVEKMSCVTCPITVRKAMERVDGVVKVEVDYDTKVATVTFDDVTTTAAEIAQASTDVGYPAVPIIAE
jgi:mercuric ion binding protein